MVRYKMAQQANYWFDKGMRNKQRAAIVCYKQALTYDLEHYPTLYNLAVHYEGVGWLSSAKKWLLRLIEVNPDIP